MGMKHGVSGGCRRLFVACAIVVSMLSAGCSHFQAGPAFREADGLFARGDYQASLGAYERIAAQYPAEADRVLFETGVIYAYPRNGQKDYRKALECFQKLLREHPDSSYRHDSERMIFHIENVVLKDVKIASQQDRITGLQQELRARESEIAGLKEKVEKLEWNASFTAGGPADRILVEKGARKLTLLSDNRIIKTYRIALGANPVGPKERQGDNRTPEGTYVIDSRDRNSRYHISLRISYPNERDRRRARRLGVPPGGDIMIHGIKKGFSQVGGMHTGFDWTNGCIAVTDGEIEEIDRLVPNGTVVEIRP